MISWRTRLFSVLLAGIICFLSFSLPALAVDEPVQTYPPGYEDYLAEVELNNTMMAYFVWLLLNSWGIRVTYQELEGFNEYVESNIVNWVIEYLQSLPSSYTIDQWIAPWQVGYDYWGNFRGNDSMLEDIKDFANWLISELGLTDNSTIIIDPVYTYNGTQVYHSNELYATDTYTKEGYSYIGMARSSEVDELGSNEWPYFFVMEIEKEDGTTGKAYIFFRVTGSNVSFPNVYLGVRADGEITWIQSDTYGWVGISKFGYDFGFANPYTGANGVQNIPKNNNPYYFYFGGGMASSYNIIYRWLNSINSFELTVEGNTQIVVTTKNVPVEGDDYESGDSIIIIGDEPSYSLLDWDGTVVVSNLPAIVSTGTIPVPGSQQDPGMIAAFRPISALITAASDGVALMLGIIYEFPEEVIIPIYAVLGAMILFGTIHLMKEH